MLYILDILYFFVNIFSLHHLDLLTRVHARQKIHRVAPRLYHAARPNISKIHAAGCPTARSISTTPDFDYPTVGADEDRAHSQLDAHIFLFLIGADIAQAQRAEHYQRR